MESSSSLKESHWNQTRWRSVSAWGKSERLLSVAELCWRCQHYGTSTKESYKQHGTSSSGRWFAIRRAGRKATSVFDIGYRAIGLGVCPAGLKPCCGHCAPSPAFWNVHVFSVPLYAGSMWFVFLFWFYKGLKSGVSEDFELLNCWNCETMGTFEVGLIKYTFHCDIATSLQGPKKWNVVFWMKLFPTASRIWVFVPS